DAAQIVGFLVLRLSRPLSLTLGHWPPNVGMLDNVSDFAGDLARGTHRIDEDGTDRVARHFGELRARFILRECKTARCFDRAQPGGSVTAGAGKKHTDPAAAACFGERFEKLVNGYV